MQNSLSTQWYVVYTKPRWEKKVAENLQKRNIVHYCPLNKVVKQWHDRKKTVQEPLFTSYVFVKASLTERSFIQAVPGIVNFVYWLGKPAVVREQEIIAIREFVDEYQTVELHKINVNVNVDDVVTVVNGPLMNREGRILQVVNNFVKIELPSIGYSLIAKVKKTSVKVIESNTIGKSVALR